MGSRDIFRGREIFTGRMAEADLFDRWVPSKKAVNILEEWKTSGRFIPLEEMMDLVRTSPQGNPLNPSKPFARELRKSIASFLSLSKDDENQLKFYTAVSSPLDLHGGTDAWIELIDKTGVRRVVTLDGTINPNKDSTKADVLIGEVPDPTEDQSGFQHQVQYIAERVAMQFGFEKKKQEYTTLSSTAPGVVRRVKKAA